MIIPPKEFIEILKSQYASRRDLHLKKSRKEKIQEFQNLYWKLVKKAASLSERTVTSILKEMAERSSTINRYARVTGDAVIHISEKMMQSQKDLDSKALHKMFQEFVQAQTLLPKQSEEPEEIKQRIRSKQSKKVFHAMLKAVEECREGI